MRWGRPGLSRARAPLVLLLAVILCEFGRAQETPSGSASQSASCSQSTTPTPTPSQGQSRSQSRTRSASETGTPSQSMTPSRTSSPTQTQTLSPTQGASPSWSQTQTATQSLTSTETQTSSITQTLTRTPSLTSSGTPSQTLTQSRTPTGTQTPSQTQSVTRTPSQTATGTGSPSETETPSSSGTQSQSPSQTFTASATTTRSQTQSASQTQTQSPSQSITPSGTETASATHSSSQSVTASQSLTPSQTQSASQTQTQTPSQSQTPSTTQSPSQTQSPSSTQTPSQTQTLTNSQSQTASATTTPSQSGTPSVTATPSETHTASPTQSPSQSQTQTASLTASQSQTPSQTQTQSPSVTQSPSQSQSHTPSQTSVPFTLTLQSVAVGVDLTALSPPPLGGGGGGGGADAPVPLSDSTPPVAYTAWLNRCPDPWLKSDGLDLVCTAAYDDAASLAGAPAGAGGIYAVVEVVPGTPRVTTTARGGAGAPFDIGPACAAAAARSDAGLGAWGQQVLLPATIALAPAFRAATGPGALTCRALGAGGEHLLAEASLQLAISGTHWPLAADVIAITGRADSLAEEERWRADSSQLGPPPNATAALAALSSCGAVPTTAADAAYGACAVAAVQAIWAGVPAPNRTAAAGASARPFALNVSGTTLLVLRSEAPGAFTWGTSATVGGEPCGLAFVTPDGAWAALSTPSAAALCGSSGSGGGGTCGFNTLVVMTPTDAAARAAQLACPPFCPGALAALAARAGAAPADAAIPLPLDAAGAAFAPALASTVAAGHAAHLPGVAAAAPPGIHYEPSCVDTGRYTDPNSGACTNTSDSASFACAYGAGRECSQCPSNALCPGGSRMWPRAGFFAFSEDDTSMQACGPPDPTTRCLGWDRVTSTQVCGAAYLQGSYLCGACADHYYPASDGSCAACPVATSGWQRYQGLVFVLAAIAALVAAVYGLLLVVVVKIGGTIKASATHAVDLGVWTVMTAQAVAQVAAVSSRSLPPLLASFFSAMGVLNLQGLVLPPACSGSYAFTTEVLIMGTALFFALATICVRAFVPPTARMLQTLGRGFVTAALVTLPPAATHALSLVYCVPTSLTPTAIRVMDGGATVLAAAGFSSNSTGLLTVNVLESDPFFVCWTGSHTLAGGLAAATLLLFVGGFSTLLFVWVWQDPPLRQSVTIERAEIARLKAERQGANPRSGLCRRSWGACCCTRRQAMLSSTLLPQCSPAASPGPGGSEPGGESPLSVPNPLREAIAAKANPKRSKRLSQAGLRAAPLPSTILLVSFLADYRPLAWYTRFLDMGLTVTLAAVQAFLRLPTTGQQVLLKTCVTCVPTLGLCAHVLFVRPFLPDDAWKGWVRALLLTLAMGCASISGASSLLVSSSDGIIHNAGVIAGLAGGTYSLLVICVFAAGLLIAGVSRAIIRLAVIEEREIREKKEREAQRQRIEAEIASAGGAGTPAESPPGGADPAASGARMVFVNPMIAALEGAGGGEPLAAAEEGRGEHGGLPSGGGYSAAAVALGFVPEAREAGRFASRSSRRRVTLPQRPAHRSASRLVTSITTLSAAGDISATVDACNALLQAAPSDLRPSKVKGVVAALTGLLQGAAAAGAEGAESATAEAEGGPPPAPGAGIAGPAAVESLCRTLTAVSLAFPGAAAGTAAVVAQVMAAHASSPAAMEQACMLAGNASGDSRELSRFVRAGGAASIVGVLHAQLDLLGQRQGGASTAAADEAASTDGDAAAIAALTQALVTLCSIAGSSRGSAALVAAGAVSATVAALGRLAADDVAVAEAGCLALSRLLRKAPGAAHEALAACGGAGVLLEQLRSPRAARDADIAASAATALRFALEGGQASSSSSDPAHISASEAEAAPASEAAGTASADNPLSDWVHDFRLEMAQLLALHADTPAADALDWLARHARAVSELTHPSF